MQSLQGSLAAGSRHNRHPARTPPFYSHSEGAGPSGDPGSEYPGVLHLHFPDKVHPDIQGKLPKFL